MISFLLSILIVYDRYICPHDTILLIYIKNDYMITFIHHIYFQYFLFIFFDQRPQNYELCILE